MRIQLLAVMSMYYVVCLGLLSSNFLFNLVGRSLVFTISDVIVQVARLRHGEANILAAIILHCGLMLLAELIFYVQ